jgi:hypothetical protein
MASELQLKELARAPDNPRKVAPPAFLQGIHFKPLVLHELLGSKKCQVSNRISFNDFSH